MPGPALSVRNLAKRYGAIQAVGDLSFEVQPGTIFGLIGPNGAGKTTTLECILGLCRPDTGAIEVLGIDALRNPSLAKEKVGAQLQNSALPDAMTPRQALRLCGSFYRQAARPDELLEQFLLSDKADARYATLSGGQRQRLALALAFVNQPELVVLDEPTAGLDPPTRRELHQLIAAQRSAGRTLILSTHYLEEARALCDRIGLIDRGVLVAVDAPEALIAASSVRPHLLVRTQPNLTQEEAVGLPGVTAASLDGLTWRLQTDAVNRTVAAVGGLVERRGGEILSMEIHRPTLDDVFLERTQRNP